MNKALILPGVCAGLLLGAAGCVDEPVEGGSALYTRAVHESVQGLTSHGTKQEAVPAGEVCPQCGKVHPPVSSLSTNAIPVLDDRSPIDQPPLTPNPDPARYYYCAKCRAYHLRPAPGEQPDTMPLSTNVIEQVPKPFALPRL